MDRAEYLLSIDWKREADAHAIQYTCYMQHPALKSLHCNNVQRQIMTQINQL